jgi:hypothetical protein
MNPGSACQRQIQKNLLSWASQKSSEGDVFKPHAFSKSLGPMNPDQSRR